MSSIDEWQGWLLSPPGYAALRSLPPEESQKVFDEANRRAFGGSVLTSGVVWLLVSGPFVPFTLRWSITRQIRRVLTERGRTP